MNVQHTIMAKYHIYSLFIETVTCFLQKNKVSFERLLLNELFKNMYISIKFYCKKSCFISVVQRFLNDLEIGYWSNDSGCCLGLRLRGSDLFASAERPLVESQQTALTVREQNCTSGMANMCREGRHHEWFSFLPNSTSADFTD